MTVLTDQIAVALAAETTDETTQTAPAGLEHLSERARTLMGATKKQRIEQIYKDFVVRHTAFMEPYNYVLLQVLGCKRTRAKGVLLVGEVGAGKTTFGKLLVEDLARPNAAHSGVVMISLTGATSMRAVYGRILENLQGPVSASQRTSDRELAVLRLLSAIGCRLLIVDEIQDVLNSSPREQLRTLSALKFLMNQLQLPIVALGVEDAERAFSSDPHLDARFRAFRLPRWKADDNLVDLLAMIETELPLMRPSQLRSQAAIGFLVTNSEGSLDGILTLIRTAAVHAILTGEERITQKMLELALTVPDVEETLRDE